MKKLFIILFSLGIVASASAQRHWGGGAHYVPRTRVIVGVGAYAPFGYYPYGYYGYSPFGYPPVYREARPSKLDLQIEDIKADYKDRIWSARHDKSLSRAERKNTVHQLKAEREQAIIDAKRDYYKSPR